MRSLPAALARGPFTRSTAFHHGMSPRQLEGPRFVRLHSAVYRHRFHVMSWEDDVEAERLALPEGSATTGITRVQQLGLDLGPRHPLHFVVRGDHHAKLDGVFLHRTIKQPEMDAVGVTPAAAFVECTRWQRVIELIKVGDWLIREGHMTLDDVARLTGNEPWRAGAKAAEWALQWLDGDARSLPESELRSLIAFSGLPAPLVNCPIELNEHLAVLGDLWWPRWRFCLEYEGAQHQTDRDQYVADIDRYRLMRQAGISYVLVTKERLRTRASVVREVHRALVLGGYSGPGPDFGELWQMLFAPIPERRLRSRRHAA